MSNNIHNAPHAGQVKATLYFGANITTPLQDAREDLAEFVTDKMFEEYLTHVTPHFPGFTVATNLGYWKGKPEVVRVLTILAPVCVGRKDCQVRQFAEQYKTMFTQEAVAYDFTPCQFTLDCWPYGPVKTYHTPGKGY